MVLSSNSDESDCDFAAWVTAKCPGKDVNYTKIINMSEYKKEEPDWAEFYPSGDQ